MRRIYSLLSAIIIALLLFVQFSVSSVIAQSVSLPACDGNPDARILTPSDSMSVFNTDTAHTVFCLRPGKYPHIILTRACTSDKKCYIRGYDVSQRPWVNADTGHAVQNATLESLTLSDASYWTIDNLSIDPDKSTSPILELRGASAHNLINDVLAQDASRYDTVIFRDSETIYNTLQNSVVRNSRRATGSVDANGNIITNGDDAMCVAIWKAKFTSLVNNEIYNCTDGIQIYNGGNSVEIDSDPTWSPEGTSIENNEIYITPAMYANCANNDPNTSLTPGGRCACAENAIDIKVTTKKSDAEMKAHPEFWTNVRGNVMHGFKNTHPTCGGTGSNGNAVETHWPHTGYILFENNVIYDAPVGFGMGKPSPHHITIRNNLFSDIHTGHAEGVFNFAYGNHNEVYNNTILGGTDTTKYMFHYSAATEYDIRNNLFVRSGVVDTQAGNSGFGSTSMVGYNAFIATTEYSNAVNPPHDVVKTSVSDALLTGQYCYIVNKLTAPKTVCISDVIPSNTSPLVNAGDLSTGSRPNIGIDDATGILKDMRRVARSGTPDIGAFESGSNSSPLPSPRATPSPASFVKPLLGFWLQSGQDQNGDGKVNTLDFARLLL